MHDFLTIYLCDTAANKYLNTCVSSRILTLKDLLVCPLDVHLHSMYHPESDAPV